MKHTQIHAFNIFTGKSRSFATYTDAQKATGTCFNTLKYLLEEGRPHYNSGWMFSYEPKVVWVQMDHIVKYNYKRPKYYDRLYSNRYHRIARSNTTTL